MLNAAGEYLREQAAALTRDLHQMRRGALRAAGREGAALSIAATHALSFTFFPGWIRSFSPLETLGTLNLISDTMAACERILLAGDADFLLCHCRADVPTGLTPDAFTSLVVGTDLLVPVSAPDPSGAARWALPGTPAAPVRLLAYSGASGLSRILEAMQRSSGKALSLDHGVHLAARGRAADHGAPEPGHGVVAAHHGRRGSRGGAPGRRRRRPLLDQPGGSTVPPVAATVAYCRGFLESNVQAVSGAGPRITSSSQSGRP